MPKKQQHGRPQRQKPRPRRTPAAVPATGAVADVETPEAAPQFAAQTATAPASRPATRTTTTAARRPASASRRAPVMVMNYSYLRRDLATLAILAPSMVVVLVVAFFVFH